MKSKYLSYLLRHDTKTVMDEEGWVNISELPFTLEELELIVKNDSKNRFQLEGNKIRAVQGHSKVVTGFKEATPPPKLFHGSNLIVEPLIKIEGLKKMKRHHVHLSEDYNEAIKVAIRRKKGLVVFEIDTQSMLDDNFQFYKADNGVWLVESVPATYITPTYPECY